MAAPKIIGVAGAGTMGAGIAQLASLAGARTLLHDPIPRALERMCGLQDQYAPSGYIGLWTRIDGMRRGDLTRALERRSVIQATLMRATIHLVSKRDFWPFAAAIVWKCATAISGRNWPPILMLCGGKTSRHAAPPTSTMRAMRAASRLPSA